MSKNQNLTKEICKAIEDIRNVYPDLRFGQILINAVDTVDARMYFMTDQELINALEDYLALSNMFTPNL